LWRTKRRFTRQQNVESKNFNLNGDANPKIVIIANDSSDNNSKNATSPKSQIVQDNNLLSKDSPKKYFKQNLEQKDVKNGVEDKTSVSKDIEQKNLASQEILSVQSINGTYIFV